MSEDDADDVTTSIACKEDQMNTSCTRMGEINSEYKNRAQQPKCPQLPAKTESSNCEENDAMVEERNAILSELQLYEESGDFLVNTQDSLFLRENTTKIVNTMKRFCRD